MELEGTTAIVVAGARPLGESIAADLSRLGATIELTGPPGDRDEAVATFAAAAERIGAVDAVVHVAGVDSRLEDRALVDADEETWDREAEAPIRSALFVLQGARECFGERGGSIVVAIPTIALTGAAGLVPFASASEGIRLLVKSAARDWGRDGVRVNCVTLPIEAWGVDPPEDHRVPNRFGASLDDTNGLGAGGAVALLLSRLSTGVTGATVGVDHGTVMAP
jgi:NAD(P)-dependent dehydrogenase (short-subunit alcohol dehydrogenase family)